MIDDKKDDLKLVTLEGKGNGKAFCYVSNLGI